MNSIWHCASFKHTKIIDSWNLSARRFIINERYATFWDGKFRRAMWYSENSQKIIYSAQHTVYFWNILLRINIVLSQSIDTRNHITKREKSINDLLKTIDSRQWNVLISPLVATKSVDLGFLVAPVRLNVSFAFLL